jgi:hypothetical protein
VFRPGATTEVGCYDQIVPRSSGATKCTRSLDAAKKAYQLMILATYNRFILRIAYCGHRWNRTLLCRIGSDCFCCISSLRPIPAAHSQLSIEPSDLQRRVAAWSGHSATSLRESCSARAVVAAPSHQRLLCAWKRPVERASLKFRISAAGDWFQEL